MPASCGTRSLVSQAALSGVFKLHFYGIVKLVFVTLFCAIFRVMFSSIELVLGISMRESCPAILGHIMRQNTFHFPFSNGFTCRNHRRPWLPSPDRAPWQSSHLERCYPPASTFAFQLNFKWKFEKWIFLSKSCFYFLSYQEEEKSRFRLVKLHDK